MYGRVTSKNIDPHFWYFVKTDMDGVVLGDDVFCDLRLDANDFGAAVDTRFNE